MEGGRENGNGNGNGVGIGIGNGNVCLIINTQLLGCFQ
jgi:hypothetical protein